MGNDFKSSLDMEFLLSEEKWMFINIHVVGNICAPVNNCIRKLDIRNVQINFADVNVIWVSIYWVIIHKNS